MINAQNIIIRHELSADYQSVETLTRKAFWNLYVPGCIEHYLVRALRPHPDFISELDLVAELDGQIVGNVMYTKAQLTDETGHVKPILTFGPLCVAPEYQRQGIGKHLLKRSFTIATELGYDTIVIFGMPSNYVARGFESCLKHRVALPNHCCPAAMLVKELASDVLAGHTWIYTESPAMAVDLTAAAAYDATLPPLAKNWQASQEEFEIISHATLHDDVEER
ncbi:GNAT family N-acetyltransferase [Lactiplantibacillus carotarum]|uniref:GNAT family N-acetyltransferase n=1 Tax=Lactiplantibacillus carotarum TaxID=2993456 RepID=UPI00298ED57E|nr:N-acetyltransferase [Lactiplantibacillus carotarum]